MDDLYLKQFIEYIKANIPANIPIKDNRNNNTDIIITLIVNFFFT